MKATVDGVTYEGTPDEIRDIVRDPPTREYDAPRVVGMMPGIIGGYVGAQSLGAAEKLAMYMAGRAANAHVVSKDPLKDE